MSTMTLESPVMTDQTVCCPEFDPSRWDYKRHEWKDKLFLKDTVPQLFHIPLPGTYGKAITRMWTEATEAGAAPELKDFILLAHDPSPFKSELFLSITKEVPGKENVRLSGSYISRVFDGPYNHVPQYIKETDLYLASLNLVARKYYFYYAYCPNCSKKYGHNYIVALAEV